MWITVDNFLKIKFVIHKEFVNLYFTNVIHNQLWFYVYLKLALRKIPFFANNKIL